MELNPQLLVTLLSGPCSALFVALWFTHQNDKKQALNDERECKEREQREGFERKDRAQERDRNAAEREFMAQKFKDTISEITTAHSNTTRELKDSFQENLSSVLAKAAESERLQESKFQVLLADVLKNKGENIRP
jgi:hypothetical protein